MPDDKNTAPFATHLFLDAFDISGNKIMGRQAAGHSFLNSLFKENYDEIALYISHVNDDPRVDVNYKKIVSFLNASLSHSNDPKVSLIPYNTPVETAQYGGIFRPDPNIQELAHHRGYYGHDSYSLIGITHTTASHEIMNCIKDILVAPLMPWDALICTSKSVKDTVQIILDDYFDFLKNKIGATSKPEIQLPIIPLGINVEDFTNDNDREDIRKSFGIEKEDIAILFVGRLSFHAKAHNIPMFLALENIKLNNEGAKLHFIMAGWFPNDEVKEMYVSDAKLYCPSVNVIFLDGRDQKIKFDAYSAGDIFFSLTDNIQETFGLTPLEGMAAGLPVVVSDWNGYRETVRDGIDGFRITTTSYPEELSNILAFRYDIGLDTYDRYCGYHSQYTSVNIEEAVEKLQLLIENKDLRLKLGKNAKKHAFEKFNWSSILKTYSNLKDDLKSIKAKESGKYLDVLNKISSDRLPPYKIFKSYPSRDLNMTSSIKKMLNVNSFDFKDLYDNSESIWYAKPVLPELSEINLVLESLSKDKYESIKSLSEKLNIPSELAIRIVALLSKYGYINVKE